MTHNILITGSSGYLGGTILARWKSVQLPPYNTLYALVRRDDQADAVKSYGAVPLFLDLKDDAQVTHCIIKNQISIIFFLVDAYGGEHQKVMIKALKQVKDKTGHAVHFLHTTGAKQFSRHAGISTDRPLLDNDPELYNILNSAVPPHNWFAQSVRANINVIDAAEDSGVRSYILAPCIVYGEGEGFGNRTAIQDVTIVQAAKALRRVFKVDTDNPVWPVCHVVDTARLYLQILAQILRGSDIGYGKKGFYLAASGSVYWNDIYQAFAEALAKREIVDSAEVKQADDIVLARIGELLGVSPSVVPVLIGGKCTFTAVHGNEIGWKAEYPPEHIIEAADAEVELILKTLDSGDSRSSIR
ncbi:hypothetical protein BDV09DRAFT_206482 [Aspergillus tetrazonus]